MAQITFGSRIRTSPFHQATVAAGATSFTIYNKMYMPTGFGDPGSEYHRLTNSVALWDVAAERQVEITGPDAHRLVDELCARDLSAMRVGRAKYAPMCDHDGRLINDPVALRIADDRFWLSLADSDMLFWVRAVAGERGAEVTVCEPDVSPLAIQGPSAPDVARALFGAETVDSLGFFHHCSTSVGDIPVELCRSGWSKQGGYELFLTDGSRGSELWERVMAAGEPFEIGPGTPNHQERLESGLLSFGSDHDGDTDPVEAGLGAFVDLDGSDFIGRQALRRRLERERRPIVNVTLDGEPVPCEQPWVATLDNQTVGELRTATWSPRLESWIGIAQLRSAAATPGTVVLVHRPAVEAEPVLATVTPEPFGTVRTV